jgi:predicted enzyme related to lactoylglutathione lyase
MTNGDAVRQLRVVVETEDYDAAVRWFRDVLGLAEEEAYAGDDGAQVMILSAGRATLELANPAQRRMIDDVEVGQVTTGQVRLAFEVDDSVAATERMVSGGAAVVAPPTETPWRSLNARLESPTGIQVTLFQELDG